MGFNNSKVLILYVLSCLFVTSVSLIVLNYSVDIIWADEWDTPGNLLIKEISDQTNVEFSDFISQHNESLKFFQNLLLYFI